jgi:hypothetical protein
MNQSTCTRRSFLASAGGLVAGAYLPTSAAAPVKPLKVAAIYTVFRHRSHAHDIIENFLEPCLFNGEKREHGMKVVSFFADQRAETGDMTDDVAKQYNVTVYKTIEEALTLGGKELAVDAVLSIGEHGDYPSNELGQVEYPRKRFFDSIVAVMKKSNRFVPIFNDKHLSYRWDWAKEMVDTARKHGIPLMASSSVPLAQRIPAWEFPKGAVVEDAISIHSGGPESYDFHGAEVLQSIIEARKGGETGISKVEFITGDALWKAAADKRWSLDLANLALAQWFGKEPFDIKKMGGTKETEPHALLLTYKDGARGTVLKVGRQSDRWLFACKLKGDDKPHAFRWYVGPWRNRNLFKALSNAIQHHFREGKSPYPPERTLMTTGIVEAAMRSRAQGKAVATPHLEFAYEPVDFKAFRETGASWEKVLTEETPELKGITPFGGKKKS